MKIWKAMATPAALAALCWAIGCGSLSSGVVNDRHGNGGGADAGGSIHPNVDAGGAADSGIPGHCEHNWDCAPNKECVGGTCVLIGEDGGMSDGGGGFDGGAGDAGASDAGTASPGFPMAYGLVREPGAKDGGAGVDAGNGNERAGSVVRPAAGGVAVAGRIDSISDSTWILKLDDTGAIEWQKTYAHGGWEYQTVEMKGTSDGGFVVVGTGSVADRWGVLVMRLAADGALSWGFVYAVPGSAVGRSIEVTPDGGCVVAGEDTAGAWVLKLDAGGAIEWQKSYATGDPATVARIRRTSDGGYLVAGSLESAADRADAWVMKLDAAGAIAWERRLVSAAAEAFGDAVESGAGYVAAGYGAGGLLAVRLDAAGAVAWQRSYGGGGYAKALHPVVDGSVVVAGAGLGLRSDQAGEYDGWLLKLAPDGAIQWQRRYGGGDDDSISALAPDGSGGLVLAGATFRDSALGDDYWVFRVTPDGSVGGGCGGYGEPTDATVSAAVLDARDGAATAADTAAVPTGVAITVTDTKAISAGVCTAP